MKHDVLNKISRVINYEESERVRLNVYVDQLGDQQEEYLLIGEELHSMKSKRLTYRCVHAYIIQELWSLILKN